MSLSSQNLLLVKEGEQGVLRKQVKVKSRAMVKAEGMEAVIFSGRLGEGARLLSEVSDVEETHVLSA